MTKANMQNNVDSDHEVNSSTVSSLRDDIDTEDNKDGTNSLLDRMKFHTRYPDAINSLPKTEMSTKQIYS